MTGNLHDNWDNKVAEVGISRLMADYFLVRNLISHGFVTLIRINGDQICLKYTELTVY